MLRSWRRLLIVMVILGGLALPAGRATAEGNCSNKVSISKDGRLVEGRYRLGCKTNRAAPKPSNVRGPRPKAEPSRPTRTLTKEQWAAFLAMCKQTYSDSGCRELPVSAKLDPAVMIADLDAIARSLVVRLQLPDPTPQIGPDPEVNEWKMVAVGYPLWLWTRGPATVTTTARAYGVSFTMQATWLSTSFDMGDGHRVTCSSTAVYDRSVRPGAESPSCGYRYETSSLPRGNYSVTATTNWRITWRALGQSGSLPGSYSGTRSLPVGELNALVVR